MNASINPWKGPLDMTWIPRFTTPVVPVLDTAAYAAGDVLFNPTVIPDVFNKFSDRCLLQSVHILDEDAQTAANNVMTLLFLQSNVSLGALNAAPNISDANARQIIGQVTLAAGDFVALGAVSTYGCKGNLNIVLDAAAGSKDLWVAAIAGAAPTHTVSGLRVGLGLLLRP